MDEVSNIATSLIQPLGHVVRALHTNMKQANAEMHFAYVQEQKIYALKRQQYKSTIKQNQKIIHNSIKNMQHLKQETNFQKEKLKELGMKLSAALFDVGDLSASLRAARDVSRFCTLNKTEERKIKRMKNKVIRHAKKQNIVLDKEQEDQKEQEQQMKVKDRTLLRRDLPRLGEQNTNNIRSEQVRTEIKTKYVDRKEIVYVDRIVEQRKDTNTNNGDDDSDGDGNSGGDNGSEEDTEFARMEDTLLQCQASMIELRNQMSKQRVESEEKTIELLALLKEKEQECDGGNNGDITTAALYQKTAELEKQKIELKRLLQDAIEAKEQEEAKRELERQRVVELSNELVANTATTNRGTISIDTNFESAMNNAMNNAMNSEDDRTHREKINNKVEDAAFELEKERQEKQQYRMDLIRMDDQRKEEEQRYQFLQAQMLQEHQIALERLQRSLTTANDVASLLQAELSAAASTPMNEDEEQDETDADNDTLRERLLQARRDREVIKSRSTSLETQLQQSQSSLNEMEDYIQTQSQKILEAQRLMEEAKTQAQRERSMSEVTETQQIEENNRLQKENVRNKKLHTEEQEMMREKELQYQRNIDRLSKQLQEQILAPASTPASTPAASIQSSVSSVSVSVSSATATETSKSTATEVAADSVNVHDTVIDNLKTLLSGSPSATSSTPSTPSTPSILLNPAGTNNMKDGDLHDYQERSLLLENENIMLRKEIEELRLVKKKTTYIDEENTVVTVQGDDDVEPTPEELEIYDINVEVIETHNADGSKTITKLKKKRLKKKKPPKRKNIRAAINSVGNERARKLLYNFRDSSDFLDAFTDENIEQLVNFLDIVPFMHGDKLIKQNEEASWAGFVLDGNMGVEVNGNKVATLQAGAIIGELAVLEGGSRTATCLGAGGGVIGAISFDNLDTLHEEDPELAVKLFTAFGIAGVAKLRARLTTSSGKDDKSGKKKRRRKKIDTKGKGKKKKDGSFMASSAAEVFYTNLVKAAERETEAAGEEKKKADDKIKKMKQKAKTEAVLRQRANRQMEEMREQIAKLQHEVLAKENDGDGDDGVELTSEESKPMGAGAAISKFKKAARKAAALKFF